MIEQENLAKAISKKTGIVVMRLYIIEGRWWASTVGGEFEVSEMLRGRM